ncbi:MAG: mechanosensitive ion channel family protein [Marichromatium sp.]|nr:mechanosensitive ion channel family protein [Marichromatium sp.]
MLTTNFALTIGLVVLIIVISKLTGYFITKIGERKKVIQERVYYVTKFSHFIIIFMGILFLAVIWNVQLGGIMIFASSIFAVIGVALFAQWSILSNLTSSIIIFFTFPARVGDKIKVVDGDNSITGEIIEISLFQIEILDEDENIVLYPNNLFIQKPIMKLRKKESTKTPLEEVAINSPS